MTVRIHFKFPFLAVALILLVWARGPLCSAPPDSEETSRTDLAARLSGFRSLLDRGQLIKALKFGCDSVQDENLFNNSLLVWQESLLFEVAVAHLDYIDKILNPDQAKQCAGKAAALWKKYIEWYHLLNPEQRSTLVSGHNRINKAVAHLGNALIRKRDIDTLFDEYSNIAALDILYFGTDAILVWKNGLYGCPDGNVNKQHTSITRRESICNGCEDQWNAYALTLKDWVDVAPLRLSAKKSYLREIRQIEREIKKNRGDS